jgi:hypothetical protein
MSSDCNVSIFFEASINFAIDSSVIVSNNSVETAPGSIHVTRMLYSGLNSFLPTSSWFLTIRCSSSCNLSIRLAPVATLIPAFDNAKEVAYPTYLSILPSFTLNVKIPFPV